MQKKTKIIIAAVAAFFVVVGIIRFRFYSTAFNFCTATLHYEGYQDGEKIDITVVLEKED